MSWQKREKRLAEFGSDYQETKIKMTLEGQQEQGMDRKKEVISYEAQLSKPNESSATTCFQKPRFPTHLHAISLKTIADLWLTKYKPLLPNISSQKPQ